LPELGVRSEEFGYNPLDSLRVSAQHPLEPASVSNGAGESGQAVLARSVGDVFVIARIGLAHIKEKCALTWGREQRRLSQQEDVPILQPLAML
jgi:hypothetical protein